MKLPKLNRTSWPAALVFVAATTVICLAQAVPPAPLASNAGGYSSVAGAISQLNYGPEMEATSFLVNGTLVTFPPHASWALSSMLRVGEHVEVSGYPSTTLSGRQRLELATMNANGKSLSVPTPGQFTAYNGSARVSQLNYNREGDVDGFLLDNGVFAKIPPAAGGASNSMVSVGTQVSLAGYSHQTMNGQTVVDVQSINGQAIADAAPGPPPPPR